MVSSSKKYWEQQEAKKKAAKAVNKDPVTKPKVKTDDLPSKSLLKKRMKTPIVEEDDNVREALEEIEMNEENEKKQQRKEKKRQKRAAKYAAEVAKAAAEGRTIKVAKKKFVLDTSVEPLWKRKLFIGNLPEVADKQALREHFAEAGGAGYIWFLRPPGTAWLAMKHEADLEAALKLNGKPFAGRELEVRLFQPSDQPELNEDLEVIFRNLPNHAKRADVYNMFKACGETSRILMHHRKHAFVTYMTLEGFNAAVALNNTEWKGKTLEVKKARSKEERYQERLEHLKRLSAETKDVEMNPGDAKAEEEEEDEDDDEDDEGEESEEDADM